MDKHSFTTLSEAVNTLTAEGYKEDFEARENSILALYSKKDYQPSELNIVATFRFEGITDPSDEATVFAIVASDGTKGTLVMSYSAEHGQNVELIRQIPYSQE
ncbi:phosphoribosylpyrophosphate synthetase [Allomuricauda sp. NBRC 101325]|uniref:phosphoribosylpyrophosphate synthetase n=1 Tax=Allomuricauda sp. NBRC 101325 TaxID=1113758 RepID=UPI0024A5CA48|nr:phosphoribosylpyrophosphate synthetase [Muricauda sp. NBRC 101325]GLU42553.1 hypothetical protein Musp01_01770 [Muricauda sp. NBRC 101325]